MKKITVKHYLNKQLKPEIEGTYIYYPLYVSITVNSKNIRRKSGIHEYITENDFENNFINEPDTIRKIKYESDLFSRIVKLFMNDIEKQSVRKELITFITSKGYNSKDDFINYLNAYIDYYSYSFFDAIDNYCTNEIEKEIYNKVSKIFNFSNQEDVRKMFQYKTTTEEIDFIYKNSCKENIELLVLRERLRSFLAPYSIKTGYDLPLMDWLDGMIQNELKDFLSTYKRSSEYYFKQGFVIDNVLIDKFINIIDNVINSKEYFNSARSLQEINI